MSRVRRVIAFTVPFAFAVAGLIWWTPSHHAHAVPAAAPMPVTQRAFWWTPSQSTPAALAGAFGQAVSPGTTGWA
jgi:hypothetical protein